MSFTRDHLDSLKILFISKKINIFILYSTSQVSAADTSVVAENGEPPAKKKKKKNKNKENEAEEAAETTLNTTAETSQVSYFTEFLCFCLYYNSRLLGI